MDRIDIRQRLKSKKLTSKFTESSSTRFLFRLLILSILSIHVNNGVQPWIM